MKLAVTPLVLTPFVPFRLMRPAPSALEAAMCLREWRVSCQELCRRLSASTIHVYIYIYICVCVCVYIYIYIYIHVIYIYIYIVTCCEMWVCSPSPKGGLEEGDQTKTNCLSDIWRKPLKVAIHLRTGRHVWNWKRAFINHNHVHADSVKVRGTNEKALAGGPQYSHGGKVAFHLLSVIIPYYNIIYYTILYYTILYYTILYYTILYYTIIYYIISYYTAI